MASTARGSCRHFQFHLRPTAPLEGSHCRYTPANPPPPRTGDVPPLQQLVHHSQPRRVKKQLVQVVPSTSKFIFHPLSGRFLIEQHGDHHPHHARLIPRTSSPVDRTSKRAGSMAQRLTRRTWSFCPRLSAAGSPFLPREVRSATGLVEGIRRVPRGRDFAYLVMDAASIHERGNQFNCE